MHEDTPFTAQRTLRAVLAAAFLVASTAAGFAQSENAPQPELPSVSGFSGVERGPALPFLGMQAVTLSAQLTAESPQLTRG